MPLMRQSWFIFIAIAMIGIRPTRGAVAPTKRPPVFAAYYVRYSTPDGPHRKWAGWRRDEAPPAREPAGINAAAYPLIGPYDSDDPEVARWHIRLAQSAGIEAFLVSWWGPREKR